MSLLILSAVPADVNSVKFDVTEQLKRLSSALRYNRRVRSEISLRPAVFKVFVQKIQKLFRDFAVSRLSESEVLGEAVRVASAVAEHCHKYLGQMELKSKNEKSIFHNITILTTLNERNGSMNYLIMNQS